MANIVKINKEQSLVIDKDTDLVFEANCKALITVTKSAKITTTVKRGFDATRIVSIIGKDLKVEDTITLEEGATLNNLVIDTGSKELIETAILENNNSKVKHYIVSLSADKEKKEHKLLAVNKGKQTFFDITHYSLCFDASSIDVVCNATMKEGCVGSGNEQILKAIMLSEDAKATVEPLLIIDEPDLEAAGHGATIGKVDEEQMYYLMSRGLDAKQAKFLIIKGFLNPIFDEITDEKFKEDITQKVEKYVR